MFGSAKITLIATAISIGDPLLFWAAHSGRMDGLCAAFALSGVWLALR
ncbi:MAG: hypothetical protein QGH20_05125 [Candidatus Latescibacteria bacterium]|nr:hypothetical protein [Candidatus Latescibacterota bacterium]